MYPRTRWTSSFIAVHLSPVGNVRTVDPLSILSVSTPTNASAVLAVYPSIITTCKQDFIG